MKKEFIYALTHWVDGEKKYFYVGRSEREQGVRFKEHIANVKQTEKHKEDVYQYIRDFVQCEIFEEEVLCWCEDENPDDYEDFYVIKLIRAGHDLKNSKHGDAKRIAATELANSAEIIETVRDVRVAKERKAFERSKALKREVNGTATTESPMSAMIRKATAQFAEKIKQRREDDAVKQARSVQRDIEKAEWLKRKEELYRAGTIDALGNEIKGEE